MPGHRWLRSTSRPLFRKRLNLGFMRDPHIQFVVRPVLIMRRFSTRLVVGGPHRAHGSGKSKKAAEQSAAEALLARIGVKDSGAAARVSAIFEPNDELLPDLLRTRVRQLEQLFNYQFVRAALAATAITHASFVFENRRRLTGIFSYEPLASLGSAAVLLGFCRRPLLRAKS